MDVEKFKKIAKPRPNIDRERYEIYDYTFGDLVVSLTVLHPKKETRGHKHPWREIYFFLSSGFGVMTLGNESINVYRGDVVLVPEDVFHRVSNPMNTTPLEFYCVWRKSGSLASLRGV